MPKFSLKKESMFL